MNKIEPTWLKHPRSLIKQGTTYIKKHGFAGHEIDELAKAVPIDNPAGPNRNELMDLADKRPNAEIVATAKMMCLAQWVLDAWELGKDEMATELMYYLGRQEAAAKTFVINSGYSANLALRLDSFLAVVYQNKEYSEKHIMKCLKFSKASADRVQNARDSALGRDKHICSKGREFLKSGTEHHDLTSKVLNHFTKNNLWKIYSLDKPLSTKHIRSILRKGKVIPSPKK